MMRGVLRAELCFATPRRLPKARDLRGSVVVLDIAFVSDAAGHSFEKTTAKLIHELGPRLKGWIDHHDSVHHAAYAADPRFVLCTKAEHGACPEIIDPSLVKRIGPVDTIVCHGDFDGLVSAAKWLREGIEPYPGSDADAHAIDTRLGTPSSVANRIDRALRARPRDHALFGLIVRHLATGLEDATLWGPIDQAAQALVAVEAETRRLAAFFSPVSDQVVLVDASNAKGPYDKTLLLLIGQERAKISVVADQDTATLAAAFDSGVDFLATLGISGGMPTRVSIPRGALAQALEKLGVKNPAHAL